MRIHYLQHVPFEGLGAMTEYFRQKAYTVKVSRLYAGEPLPEQHTFDWLIVMGGPMGIADEGQYPWLKDEKQCIEEAIIAGRTVLGICLGAQLIAEVLGARVFANNYREIGWFEVRRNSELSESSLLQTFPETFSAFHWHGDTFSLPAGATAVGTSEACENQGFIIDDRVLALQFHLETTRQSATELIANCANEIDGSRYVQGKEKILGSNACFDEINGLMQKVLAALASRQG